MGRGKKFGRVFSESWGGPTCRALWPHHTAPGSWEGKWRLLLTLQKGPAGATWLGWQEGVGWRAPWPSAVPSPHRAP